MGSAKFLRGISKENIKTLWKIKKEPKWMLEIRIKAWEIFSEMSIPSWAQETLKGEKIDFDNLIFYIDPAVKKASKWEDIPLDIRRTWEKLGLPEAEKKFLMGISTQLESKVIYHKVKEDLEKKGVIYLDMDTALKKHEDLVKEYFGKVVSPYNNKFAALNTAVWSGGSFIYIPPNVEISYPLHTFFRIQSPLFGQFERTLIIVEENSKAQYIEGCAAPFYSSSSLHAGVVEIIVKKGAYLKYITIQNWSKNILNLSTKSAHVYEDGFIEIIDGNIGSKITMKYPSVYLLGDRSKAVCYSLSYAKSNQIQDVGLKIFHKGKHTKSKAISKSITHRGGKNIYRGIIKIASESHKSESYGKCENMLLDSTSVAESYPLISADEESAVVRYETTTGVVEEEALFYLMSRGVKKRECESLIVLGFMEEFLSELPLEYALEFNKIIQMEISGEER